MRRPRLSRTLTAVALFAAGCGCPDMRAIVDPAGETLLELCVELALTEQERRTGLMGRDLLPSGEGLLLVFPIEDEICISNAGVSFPIDVAYADRNGVITAIERTVAANDTSLFCHGSTQQVLEVSAGELDGIEAGDILR